MPDGDFDKVECLESWPDAQLSQVRWDKVLSHFGRETSPASAVHHVRSPGVERNHVDWSQDERVRQHLSGQEPPRAWQENLPAYLVPTPKPSQTEGRNLAAVPI